MTNNAAITDSPWFWMLVYSTVPLVGLALLSQKYAQRQSRLERQYQGHVAASETKIERISGGASGTPPGDVAAEPSQVAKYSSPEDTIISLGPLLFIFLAIACLAAIMLARERLRLRRPAEIRPPLSEG